MVPDYCHPSPCIVKDSLHRVYKCHGVLTGVSFSEFKTPGGLGQFGIRWTGGWEDANFFLSSFLLSAIIMFILLSTGTKGERCSPLQTLQVKKKSVGDDELKPNEQEGKDLLTGRHTFMHTLCQFLPRLFAAFWRRKTWNRDCHLVVTGIDCCLSRWLPNYYLPFL